MKNHMKISYDFAYKTQYGAKLLCITFDKVDEYIAKQDGAFRLHSNERYKRNFDRIRYLIMVKSNISDVYYEFQMLI